MNIDPSIQSLLGDLDFDPDALKAKYLAERDRRIRSDGSDQYQEVTAEFSRYVHDPYVEPGFTREPLFDEVEVAGSVACWLGPEFERQALRISA